MLTNLFNYSYLVKYLITSPIFLVIFAIYSIICVWAIKHVLKNIEKYKENSLNSEVHKKYEMFKRSDFSHWKEFNLIIGCICFLWIKLAGIITGIIFCYLGLKLTIKKTDNKNSIEVKNKINFFVKRGTDIVLFFLGIILNVKKLENFDYKKYQKNNKIINHVESKTNDNSKAKEEIASIQISNHTSWLDILIFLNLTGTGFLAKQEVKNYPLIGLIAECINGVFVDREDKGSLGGVIEKVKNKQIDIHSGKDLSKFMIFPEGTTSNNIGILDFKKGAFISELPIKPYVIKFDSLNRISLAMDVIEMLYHFLIVISVPFHYVEIIDLPVFVPNKELFDDNVNDIDNKKKERWEKYAEILKEIMCDVSGLKNMKGGFKEKQEYLQILRKPKNE